MGGAIPYPEVHNIILFRSAVMYAYNYLDTLGGVWEWFLRIVHNRSMKKEPLKLEELEVGCVESHFLDSGSFTLVSKAKQYYKEHGGDKWAYYSTAEARQYLDDYATFVKKYQIGIDLYANVDVIGNPELTWRNQRYLEKRHGLNPVPVVHHGTDLSWLQRYLDGGYELIALGGLVGKDFEESRPWVTGCFDLVCDNPKRLPTVKFHGFGVTSYKSLWHFPWWSVDSASWTKVGAYGNILVPHKRGGRFVFSEDPYVIAVSEGRPVEWGKHLNGIERAAREVVLSWLDYIRIPLGSNYPDGTVNEPGVINRHSERKAANLLFFEEMRKHIPEWPWPFKHRPKRRPRLGVTE